MTKTCAACARTFEQHRRPGMPRKFCSVRCARRHKTKQRAERSPGFSVTRATYELIREAARARGISMTRLVEERLRALLSAEWSP